MLKKFFRKKNETANLQNFHKESSHTINFETDSLRFTFDAYLIEFQSVRSEIEQRTILQEKTINYLLILIAAVISASQIFQEKATELLGFLVFNPSINIIISILLLYFPYSIIFNNIFLSILGSYVHRVLYPKINTIARILTKHSESTNEYLSWEKNTYPKWLRGTFKWDDFRAKSMYEGFGKILFGILSVFEMIFVGSPTIVFIIFFLRIKANYQQSWDTFEIILFIIFILILISLLIGVLFGLNLFFGKIRLENLDE